MRHSQAGSSPLLRFGALLGALIFVVINFAPLWTEAEPDESMASATMIGKKDADKKARAFAARRLGLKPAHSFVLYETNSDLSGYLKKYDLQKAYLQAYGGQAPLDYYQVELVDRMRENRMLVYVEMTKGRVIGWNAEDWGPVRTVSDDVGKNAEANAEQSAEEQLNARRTAEQAVERQGYKLQDFSIARQGDDWLFTDRRRPVGEAVFTIKATVSNGQAAVLLPHTLLPQSFLNWLDRQSRSAATMSNYSLLSMAGFAIMAVIVFIRMRKIVLFGRGIVLVLLFAAIYAVSNISQYPGFKLSGGGSASDGLSALLNLLFYQFFIMVMAVAVYFCLTAGEALWRSMGRTMWPAWREPDFGDKLVASMKKGYLFGLILMGIQALLYLAADRFIETWSTNDAGDSPINMLWPWLLPLMAWAAAISEEAIYRVFGIALLKKLVGSTAIAVFITSFVWALGHTLYPVYPVYTRLIEVTVLGFVFSYVYLKYGFFTSLFAHAVMDSILMSLTLLGMGRFGLPLAVFYIALPAIVAITLRRLHENRRPFVAPPQSGPDKMA